MAKKMSKPSAKFRFSAVPVTQDGCTFYMLAIKAKTLLKLAKVSTRDPDKKTGYQRHFSNSRTSAIARFLDSGNVMPTAVIVSFKSAKFDESTRSLVVTQKSRGSWVIDGQHRMLGASEAVKDTELPVVAFVDLDLSKQIQQFVTINKEAKGVPSSLYIDLLGDLPHEKTPDEVAKERCANIVQVLNGDESSVFHNRFVIMTTPRKGELSLTNFARKAQHLFVPSKGLLASYDLNTQAKVISNYFGALEKVFPEEFKLDVPIIYQTVGFGAFMNVFPLIFNTVYARTKGGFELSDVITLFEDMSPINFDAWRERGTGAAAETSAARDIEVELHAAKKKAGKVSIRV